MDSLGNGSNKYTAIYNTKCLLIFTFLGYGYCYILKISNLVQTQYVQNYKTI